MDTDTISKTQKGIIVNKEYSSIELIVNGWNKLIYINEILIRILKIENGSGKTFRPRFVSRETVRLSMAGQAKANSRKGWI